MVDDFYQIAKLLDNIKELETPSQDQVQQILNLISEEKFAKYFFLNLSNPFWIDPLYQSGYFYKIPSPIEVEKGSFQIPNWPAGEYLTRFAENHESIVIDIINKTRTENWRVQENFIDALIKISPQAISDLLPQIDAWLDGRFSGMLPIKLNSLAEYLYDAGLFDTAILIFEIVIKPIYPSVNIKPSTHRSNLFFRSDHYWVSEFFNNQLLKLLNKNPVGILNIFERNIIQAIELVEKNEAEIAEMWVGYHWRRDIPYRQSDMSEADVLDVLIDGFRDGLIAVCNQSTEEGRKLLIKYLSSKHLIINRVALYTLRIFGEKYPELINQSLLQRDYLEKNEYKLEYQGLLRDQFSIALEDVRKKVIDWISEGPIDIDLRASRRANWENREVNNDDIHIEKEQWILYHLEIIRNFLTGEVLELFNKLTEKYGKPDIEERHFDIVTSWGRPASPISAEELSKKSFEDIKELFLSFVKEESFHNPRESLAQTFQGIVQENPEHYIGFAEYLEDPEMRYIYIYHYLSGFREYVKNKGGKLRDEIISLCEFIVSQKADNFYDSSGDHEPGLFAAQLEVARLLEEALRSDDPYLNRDQLNQIRSLLIALSHHSDPKEDEDIGTSFDPFTQSLNCVRGEAMHGIIHYSLYLVRQQGKINNEKLKRGFLEKEFQDILDEKLDISKDPSLAVHSIFGAYFPQLQYLAREWVEENLTKIFPDDEESVFYWKAAWDAYLFTSNVYKDVFSLLIHQYQRGLRMLSQPEDEHKYLGGSPTEKLAQHIMFVYLDGSTDFGHENMLLDLFYSNASDSIRASGIFWLSKVLESQHLSPENDVWKRCWALWQNRIETAETQDASKNTQEISDYMRWLKNCPLGLDNLYQVLSKSIKYFNIGYYVKLLNSYTAKYCEQFPLEAITLLKKTIFEIKESWWTPDEKDEEKILRSAIASNDIETKNIAFEIINYRGEQGDYRWKKFIYPDDTAKN